MVQREQMQFYPGERAHQILPARPLFNGFCGGCHGSMSNRELDIAVDIDVLTERLRWSSRTSQAPTSLGIRSR